MSDYIIPKPKLPTAALILACIVVIGLIGLGIAAYAAFEYIGRPLQALAFSLIVEAGMISEAIAIIRRNWLSIPGLVVSLAVSGMYNYTQAERAGALLTPPLTDPLQLVALSIGPLSAVLFLALATGRELSEHEKRVHQWETERMAATINARATEAAQKERTALEREKMNLESQERVRLAEIEAQERVRTQELAENARRERREQREREQERTRIEREQVQEHSLTVRELPANVPPEKSTFLEYKTFMSANGANHSRKELADRFGVTERCITKWAAKLRDEQPTPVMELN